MKKKQREYIKSAFWTFAVLKTTSVFFSWLSTFLFALWFALRLLSVILPTPSSLSHRINFKLFVMLERSAWLELFQYLFQPLNALGKVRMHEKLYNSPQKTQQQSNNSSRSWCSVRVCFSYLYHNLVSMNVQVVDGVCVQPSIYNAFLGRDYSKLNFPTNLQTSVYTLIQFEIG